MLANNEGVTLTANFLLDLLLHNYIKPSGKVRQAMMESRSIETRKVLTKCDHRKKGADIMIV